MLHCGNYIDMQLYRLTGDWGNIDNELMTANFKWNSEEELHRIKEIR